MLWRSVVIGGCQISQILLVLERMSGGLRSTVRIWEVVSILGGALVMRRAWVVVGSTGLAQGWWCRCGSIGRILINSASTNWTENEDM